MASSSSAGALPLPSTAELKPLTPFLQRAQELRTADPPMAYWCSLYAAQLGIGAKSTERDSKLFLGRLMDDLEAQKGALAGSDVITDETASAAYVENFALKVFTAADNQDRAGKATKATARNFLVASQFLEVLNAFGALDTEISEKVKYAKWKAADISKALKEGRTPLAGPPGGEETEAIAVTTPGDTVAESDAVMAILDSATAPSAPPAIERTVSDASSANGDNSSRLRARLSIHASNPQSPNFSMPLPVPPKTATNALEAELAAQQAELARLGLAPPDWRSSPVAPAAPMRAGTIGPGSVLSASPSGSTGRPLPVPPQGGLARDGLPNFPAGFPFPGGVLSSSGGGGPSVPSSNASLSNSTSPRLGGSSQLPSAPHFPPHPQNGSYIASSGSDGATGAIAPPLPPSSPSPYPYHQHHPAQPQPPPQHQPHPHPHLQGQPSGFINSALPNPPAPAPAPAPAPVPSAPPLPTPLPPPAAAAASSLPDSLTPSQTAKAQKLAKWAVSSLDYDDLATAAKHLREALDIVEGRAK
ncbi:hypothetical protein OC834_006206 [Tilletia horrida]|nr:hypothetical protein OC834_006206 [Tilletia horrida]KAK0558181.1 hypothetical protein OC844_005349 [Tilletia horrida]